MEAEFFNLKAIVFILTVGFAFASILGYVSYRTKFSPILGYLLAGFLIGPYSPGFVADLRISEQLAEIGVILMMFGVGLHFKWQDLASTKHVAIPGAIGQTCIATIAGMLLIYSLGWSVEAGIVFGFAIGVASTVVLVRMLSDTNLIHTPAGHLAVGWLIVEDLITVVMLLLIPTLELSFSGQQLSLMSFGMTLLFLVFKIIALVLIMFTLGQKIVSTILSKVTLTKSHELFTVTVLALTFVIAAGASFLFGVSIALGAFIGGMVMGQTTMHRLVSKNAMPMRDAFVVLFFISVGMLFDPNAIAANLTLFLCTLGIILILKPLAAFVIAIAFRQPYRTALVVSVALAQIGEFSFILAEEAMKVNILPDAGYDIIVACALISISINPLLFKLLKQPEVGSQKSEA